MLTYLVLVTVVASFAQYLLTPSLEVSVSVKRHVVGLSVLCLCFYTLQI